MKKTEKIEYNNEIIEYTVIRSRIKNVYIQIKEGKVLVKVPYLVTNKYINNLVLKKSKWIYTNLLIENKKRNNNVEISQEEKQQLKNIIKKTLQKYSNKIGEYPNKIRIKNIKYAWGSCSSKRNITINLKLAKKEEKIIEYVVLHELCHLKHMNHSKMFWELVEDNMKDYKIYRKELKKI